MSMPFSGVWKRPGDFLITTKIFREAKKINLKPVKKITLRFDPFHEKVEPTRLFFQYVTAPKRRATNPSCTINANIVCDRSEPIITFDLLSGQQLVLKSQNFSALEILELYNQHISSTVPPEEDQDNIKTKLKKKKKK